MTFDDLIMPDLNERRAFYKDQILKCIREVGIAAQEDPKLYMITGRFNKGCKFCGGPQILVHELHQEGKIKIYFDNKAARRVCYVKTEQELRDMKEAELAKIEAFNRTPISKPKADIFKYLEDKAKLQAEKNAAQNQTVVAEPEQS